MITGHLRIIASRDVWSSDLERVSAIVLRSMRNPLLFLIAVSGITVIGMVLMPGLPDADGQPTRMNFFHAVYFLTYSATTTGFGEIPGEFSDAQRLWAIFSLVTSVIAWLYAIGSIIGLLQNQHFRSAVRKRRFSISVSRIQEPFFIVCGFGDTGSLLTRGFVDAGYSVTVIDQDANRIQALQLREYPVTVPGLLADAGVPRNLIAAGLKQPNCQGVIAITNDEGINRKIVIMTHLINPSARVICRSTSEIEEEFLETLAGVSIVNPFEIFANQLSMALHRPSMYALAEWLAGAPDIDPIKPLRPPKGNWIVCGFGRMGQHLERALREREVPTVVIDPDPERERAPEGRILGHVNVRTLHAAGVEYAAGIVMATNSDSNNLGILINARMLNPDIFTLVRQNRRDDDAAFQASKPDLVMQPALVVARKILLMLLSPMIHIFLEQMHDMRGKVMLDVIHRLKETVGPDRPELWTVIVSRDMVYKKDALSTSVPQGTNTLPEREISTNSPKRCGKNYPPSSDPNFRWTLNDTMRDPVNRDLSIACVPLALKRWQQTTVFPKEAEILRENDQILFCGTIQARYTQETVLHDPSTWRYLVTGIEEPSFILCCLLNGEFFRKIIEGSGRLKSRLIRSMSGKSRSETR
uniref:Ion channel n=1 Tax=Candidatus Kentrum sp. TUN TaxID=2126343 RepID=A0A450ZZ09_9GAMM|nr:MAG: Ion channel [Candidatus Kentron sp. TUN]VFK59011.1 MAG: Ion channel [Candidatus Kentron sp. TUN]VFK67560.1 MAG: Ion channel [Candidatus Kentron sp. TUN]